MIKICTVVGARPNFMKMAPVILELKLREWLPFCVHTGQHYNAQKSTVFFDELDMPKPDVFLGVGSCSHAEQTARIMVSFEKLCLEQSPALVIVAGDVNSTLACSVVLLNFIFHLHMWNLVCARLTDPCPRKLIGL